MGALSRRSGADGERMVAHLFQKYGFKAERGVQHDGRTGHADVIGIPGLYVEVKFHARFTQRDLFEAFEQVDRDCAACVKETGMNDIIPVVIWKTKGAHGWNVSVRTLNILDMCGAPPFTTTAALDGLATYSFEDFMALYLAYERSVS